jgi:hypothetical protein
VQINRIQTFKTGPFAEHSAQLYNIAMGVPLWSKVHSGLVKMYQVGSLCAIKVGEADDISGRGTG